MVYKQVPIIELREHPQNRKYFTDIESTSKNFWQEFKTNIEKVGIIEALVVNQESMEVISGNQRLKAARELGMETVPCILCKATDSEDEIRKMISANVMRRELDPILLFEYIGILRAGYDGAAKKKDGELIVHDVPPTQRAIMKELGKGLPFMGAADIYNSLEPAQQEELRDWFHEQDKRPTDLQLIAKVKQLEKDKLISGKTEKELRSDLEQKQIALQALREAIKKSEVQHQEDIGALRRKVTALKQHLDVNKNLEAFEKTCGDTLEALNKLSAEVGRLLSRAEKLGQDVKLQGIMRVRLGQALKTTISAIEPLREMIAHGQIKEGERERKLLVR